MNDMKPAGQVILGTSPQSHLTQRLQALAARPASITVGELIDRYMAQYRGADTTRGLRLSAWKAMLGGLTLDQVDHDLMHASRAELMEQPALSFKGRDHQGSPILKRKPGGGRRSSATVNRYMAAMSAVFTWAEDERLTPKGWAHPARSIRRLREDNERVRFLDAGERERLFAAVRQSKYPRLYPLVLMAMLTGARKGELLSLRWRQVDLDAGVAILERTKNGDRRTLVLLPQLVELLRPLASPDADRFVFGSTRSKYQQPASVDTAWREALARAKIRDFRMHDLRHCCASYLAQSGASINVIAEVLGHRRLDMARRYAHLTTQSKAIAMRSALGAIGVETQ